MSQMYTCLRLEVDSYHTVIVQQLSAVRCFDKVPQANGVKGRICWSFCEYLANTLLGHGKHLPYSANLSIWQKFYAPDPWLVHNALHDCTMEAYRGHFDFSTS